MYTKKILSILLVLANLHPSISFASMEAGQLATYCKQSILVTDSKVAVNDQAITCLYYVRGFDDAGKLSPIITTNYTEDLKKRNNNSMYCSPDSISADQIIRMYVKYVDEHPESRHLLAAIILAEMMMKYFPCVTTPH
jgi:hypothetical protein